MGSVMALVCFILFEFYDGAADANAAGDLPASSSDDFAETDKLIDNISEMLKTCLKRKSSHTACHRNAKKVRIFWLTFSGFFLCWLFIQRPKARRAEQLVHPKKATSRCNLSWYSGLIKKIPDDKKSLISKFGFSCLFDFDCSGVPRSLAQWIADQVQLCSFDIILDDAVIRMSAKSFSHVVGLLDSGMRVIVDPEGSKAVFLSFMGLSDLPTIKSFGVKLLNGDLTD